MPTHSSPSTRPTDALLSRSLTGAFATTRPYGLYQPRATRKGRRRWPGYWVVTPFVLAEGGTVFVNRGFVPERCSRRPPSPTASSDDGAGDHHRPAAPRRSTPAV